MSIRFVKRAAAVLSLLLSASCLAQEAVPLPKDIVPSLLERAREHVGAPYRFGGASPRGFDCSGFVRFVFRGFGVALNRSSRAMATQGDEVQPGEFQPGDLLFFRTLGNRISHVGIYLGEGLFIHAGSRGTPGTRGVRVARLDSSYYERRLVSARRVVASNGADGTRTRTPDQGAPRRDTPLEVGKTE